MKKITIIGGGASGTLLAVNLLKNSGDTPLEINVVKKRSRVGRGVAFGTEQDSHLLNVPAAKMGAFPNDVEHFHKWLTSNGHECEPNSFVPRKLFGAYLREVFADSLDNISGSLNMIDDEAVDVSVDGGTAIVNLASGRVITTGRVVLAFGNFMPPHPSVEDQSFISAEKYFQDPWSARVYETVTPQDSIFIVGTGLSMVDVAMHFHKSGHRGKIYAVSTRGLLPAVHKLGYTYPPFHEELKPMRRITDLLKSVRRHIETAQSDGSDWRAVIDSLRPVTQEIWLNLPLAEKRYFKQHLSRYWNAARHRMPGDAAAVIDEMQADGRLQILKGRLSTIKFGDDDKFAVTFQNFGVDTTIKADALINCIGSESNYERLESPLVQNLIRSGYIRNDALSMGIDATPDGTVIGQNGSRSQVIHTLGTSLKGVLWESTAIPEIRVQANRLALKLLAL